MPGQFLYFTIIFQFLYGAIERQFSQKGNKKKNDFNSSMVRLKVEGEVTLLQSELDFNSSMVRLKDKQGLYFQGADRFQFLYGAIKRRMFDIFNNFALISIPLWCD